MSPEVTPVATDTTPAEATTAPEAATTPTTEATATPEAATEATPATEDPTAPVETVVETGQIEEVLVEDVHEAVTTNNWLLFFTLVCALAAVMVYRKLKA